MQYVSSSEDEYVGVGLSISFRSLSLLVINRNTDKHYCDYQAGASSDVHAAPRIFRTNLMKHGNMGSTDENPIERFFVLAVMDSCVSSP